MEKLSLRAETTALVLIDLQQGIVGRPELAPHGGQEVVERAARLAARFRAVGAPVVLVTVAFVGPASLKPVADKARTMPPTMPPKWDELVAGLGAEPSDIRITKRQWGAFYGTELDLQLRRRRIDTIVLGGIATAIGVESTARAAFEHGYNQVFVEDAMTSLSAEMHRYPVEHIFPTIGRVRSTAEVLEAFGGSA